MKTLKLITLGIVMLFATNSMHAQISVNLHLGTAPSWGPAGYASVDYYYLPDIEAYYDIRESQFIYLNRGTWIRSRNLPRQYSNYDLNSGYKVVLNDYHGSRPYASFRNHRETYYRGYKGSPQRTIGYKNNEHRDNEHRDNEHKDNYNRGNNDDRGDRGDNGDRGDRGDRGDNGHGNNGRGNGKH